MSKQTPLPSAKPDLSKLLRPHTIAVVGASEDFTRTGGIPVDTMLRFGFPRDRLLLVNPKYSEIAGNPCYRDLTCLPFVPDLVVLAIAAREVLPTLKVAHSLGTRAAVVFAAGFAEEGTEQGTLLQRELSAFAESSGMLIAGPNCMGFADLHERVFPTFINGSNFSGSPGSIAVLSQSGNLIFGLLRAGAEASIGFSHVISTGNEACISFTEYLEFFVDDDRSGAVIGYVEEIRDGPRFLEVARKFQRAGKPLFIIKAGTSVKGAEASASHTAAMAGSAMTYGALFRQAGILAANEPLRLIDLARVWQTKRRPLGRRVGIVSLSGAGCVLLSDLFSHGGAQIPTFIGTTRTALRKVIPSYGMVANPVDLTGQITNDRSYLRRVLQIIVSSGEVDVVVIYLTGYLLELFADDIVSVAAATEVLMVSVDSAISAVHRTLAAGNVPVFTDMNRAVAATMEVIRWSCSTAAAGRSISSRRIDSGLLSALPRGHSSLTEVETKSLLARAGLPVVRELAARDAGAAVIAAESLGYPVVVKIVSRDIAHKTEMGGVRLGVKCPEQVREAFDSVVSAANKLAPGARIEGVVVQRQILGGHSILLGVTRDPVFGPVMTVGLGGVMTEVFHDLAHRALPVDTGTAEEMLSELKSVALLNGFRGGSPSDIPALAALMADVSAFFLSYGGAITELELNPVIVLNVREGVVIVDALLSLNRSVLS
jgi:acyl-CoA synthetase (NDP forming)